MQSSNILLMVLLVATTLVVVTQGFAPTPFLRSTTCTVSTSTTQRNGIFDKVGEFFEELDAFVDDATSRRLGNGSKFYGKRRSNFYGEQDQDRKRDRTVSDPTGELRKISIKYFVPLKGSRLADLNHSFLFSFRGLSRTIFQRILPVDAG